MTLGHLPVTIQHHDVWDTDVSWQLLLLDCCSCEAQQCLVGMIVCHCIYFHSCLTHQQPAAAGWHFPASSALTCQVLVNQPDCSAVGLANRMVEDQHPYVHPVPQEFNRKPCNEFRSARLLNLYVPGNLYKEC